MTSTRHIAGPIRPRRRSTTDKIISAGLATAACAGLVGVIGVRTMEQSAAAQGTSTDAAASTDAVAVAVEPTTSTGLTQSDLEAYAAQLSAQSAQLDAYRAKLVRSAKRLKAALAAGATPASTTAAPTAKKPTAPATVTAPAPKPVAKPAPKPAAKPAPKPAAKPASNTKSS